MHNLVYISDPFILFVYNMHVVKQVVQQSSGSSCSFFISSGQNRNPQKLKIRPELSSSAPLYMRTIRDDFLFLLILWYWFILSNVRWFC